MLAFNQLHALCVSVKNRCVLGDHPSRVGVQFTFDLSGSEKV